MPLYRSQIMHQGIIGLFFRLQHRVLLLPGTMPAYIRSAAKDTRNKMHLIKQAPDDTLYYKKGHTNANGTARQESIKRISQAIDQRHQS